ncbi:LysM peptidoglycan-binding domain-containing protein [Streptacidiphilus sp. 4-A2]|nr:LysM peptidoglycan-binding domain-containing protein [Streptacidiphilus sp. 4-A2]
MGAAARSPPAFLLPALQPSPLVAFCPGLLHGHRGPGDTLSLLACRYGTNVSALQTLNSLGTSTTIRAGWKLLVPNDAPVSRGCR